MRLTSRHAAKGGTQELPMTSMIDIVFLLLIYFLSTTSIAQTEREIDAATQVKRSTGGSKSQLEPAIVEVTRGGDGFVMKLGGREFTTQAELTAVLKQFGNKADGAFVKVSDAAPFELAAAAMQACKSAGFLAISYVPEGK